MGEKIVNYCKDNDPFRPKHKCNIYNMYRNKHQLEIEVTEVTSMPVVCTIHSQHWREGRNRDD